jgi:glycosyltransferase involved in cell wall biosynthesis
VAPTTAPQPLVSVIVPTWNRADLVLDAVRSAQAQTWRHTQIIVVDDGSTDGTAEVLAGWPGILYLRQRHQGQAAARNLGLSHAQGDYVASLDSDDYWQPRFLETCLKGMQDLAADFVFANWTGQTIGGRPRRSYLEQLGYWKRHGEPATPGWYVADARRSRLMYLESCPSPSSALLFRRQPYRHGWNEEMRICDDWCLQIDSVVGEPSRVAFIMEPLWVKRARADSISEGLDLRGTKIEDWYGDLRALRRRFAGRLSAAERAILDRHELQWRLSAGRRRLLTGGRLPEAAGLIVSALAADPVFATRAIRNWVRCRVSLARGLG